MHKNVKIQKKWAALVVLFTVVAVFHLGAAESIPKLGAGLRFGGFGVPNFLLDKFAFEHPTFGGQSISFEIHTYGSKGTASTVSAVYALEYSKMAGAGLWRENEDNRPLQMEGEVSQFNLTATLIIGIFPGYYVHPYLGLGLGVGKASIWSEGTYVGDDPVTAAKETYLKNLIVPVVHIPVGISVSIADKVDFRLETGFKNGFYLAGALIYYLR